MVSNFASVLFMVGFKLFLYFQVVRNSKQEQICRDVCYCWKMENDVLRKKDHFVIGVKTMGKILLKIRKFHDLFCNYLITFFHATLSKYLGSRNETYLTE